MIKIPNLPVAFYTCDVTGVLFQFNDKFVRLLGYPSLTGAASKLVDAVLQLYHIDGSVLRPEEVPTTKCLAEGVPVNGTQIIIERLDHSKVYVSVNADVIRDGIGEITGAIAILHDITPAVELQQTNKALKASEERYHKMIEEVEDYAILLLNKEGVIQNWNKGAEKIKGYKEEEIVGRHFRAFYLPEDQAKQLPEQLIAVAIKEGKAVHEGWRMRKDKTAFWGSIVITALHDAANNIIGFSKVTRDLTERKKAEDELAFQNQELQRFTYVAAHDMKEPLRKMYYYNTYIATHGGGQLPAKERDYLKRAAAAAARMQSLIDDLLTYSKASSNEVPLEQIDLNKIVLEIKILHQETIEDTGAVIDTNALPVLKGIRFQVVQLFDNIIGNALKYRHPGRHPHIQIIADTSNEVPGRENGKSGQVFHRISIIDNGIGFEPGYGTKIFDVFLRLHNRSDYAGTGIGLAICKKIIQNHNGFIYASGIVDKGAVFTLYFPVDNVSVRS